MSVKGVLNISAFLLSAIAGLLSFVTFVLSSFYSNAQAQWEQSTKFRNTAEIRLTALEIDTKNQREIIARDIADIKQTLAQIVEVKIRSRDPRGPPQ